MTAAAAAASSIAPSHGSQPPRQQQGTHPHTAVRPHTLATNNRSSPNRAASSNSSSNSYSRSSSANKAAAPGAQPLEHGQARCPTHLSHTPRSTVSQATQGWAATGAAGGVLPPHVHTSHTLHTLHASHHPAPGAPASSLPLTHAAPRPSVPINSRSSSKGIGSGVRQGIGLQRAPQSAPVPRAPQAAVSAPLFATGHVTVQGQRSAFEATSAAAAGPEGHVLGAVVEATAGLVLNRLPHTQPSGFTPAYAPQEGACRQGQGAMKAREEEEQVGLEGEEGEGRAEGNGGVEQREEGLGAECSFSPILQGEQRVAALRPQALGQSGLASEQRFDLRPPCTMRAGSERSALPRPASISLSGNQGTALRSPGASLSGNERAMLRLTGTSLSGSERFVLRPPGASLSGSERPPGASLSGGEDSAYSLPEWVLSLEPAGMGYNGEPAYAQALAALAAEIEEDQGHAGGGGGGTGFGLRAWASGLLQRRRTSGLSQTDGSRSPIRRQGVSGVSLTDGGPEEGLRRQGVSGLSGVSSLGWEPVAPEVLPPLQAHLQRVRSLQLVQQGQPQEQGPEGQQQEVEERQQGLEEQLPCAGQDAPYARHTFGADGSTTCVGSVIKPLQQQQLQCKQQLGQPAAAVAGVKPPKHDPCDSEANPLLAATQNTAGTATSTLQGPREGDSILGLLGVLLSLVLARVDQQARPWLASLDAALQGCLGVSSKEAGALTPASLGGTSSTSGTGSAGRRKEPVLAACADGPAGADGAAGEGRADGGTSRAPAAGRAGIAAAWPGAALLSLPLLACALPLLAPLLLLAALPLLFIVAAIVLLALPLAAPAAALWCVWSGERSRRQLKLQQQEIDRLWSMVSLQQAQLSSRAHED